MEVYTVAFFGHRHVEDFFRVEAELEERLRDLLREKEFVQFLVGRNGEFDQLVSSTVRRLKRTFRSDNSSLCLVLPYETAEYRNNRESFEAYYDSVEVSPAAAGAHPKSAITLRNRDMADRADAVLCHICRREGGAWRAVRYAQKQGIPVAILGAEQGERRE